MEKWKKGCNAKIRMVALTAVILILAAAMVVGVFALASRVKEYRIIKSAHTVQRLTEENLKEIDFTSAKKLMIVAHPDDELLWGGGHLLDGGYLVVCVTNGRNSERKQEFLSVIDATGNQGLILEYPDKTNGERDNWDEVRDGISEDIALIMNANRWESIVTHNEKGEYGHQHHQMTHEIVLDDYLRTSQTSELWFFGIYHKKKTVDAYDSGEKERPADMQNRLSDEVCLRKTEISKLYSSQEKTLEGLWHMAPYENWIPYVGN